MQMSENAKSAEWYVVHTYSGYENKVKTNLEKIIENRGIAHLIHEVKVPTELIQETNKDGGTKESEKLVRRLEREIEKQEQLIAEYDEKIAASGADYQELTRLLAEKEKEEAVLMDLMEQWENAQL